MLPWLHRRRARSLDTRVESLYRFADEFITTLEDTMSQAEHREIPASRSFGWSTRANGAAGAMPISSER